MSNMKEIAAAAGVSIATVSKVLNGRGIISPETKQLVLTTARELNYRPNLWARNLKKGRCSTIGIIAEDITVFNSPMIIDGIGACCEEHGFHYLLENMRLNINGINPLIDVEAYTETVNDAVDFMMSMQVSGIIYLGCHSHKIMPLPLPEDVALVCAYCSSTDPLVPAVIYDDKKAGFDVASYLINLGHKSIGLVTGPLDSTHTQNRLAGYQEALFENNIPYNPSLTVIGNWERISGYDSANKLIADGATAIFCQNDLMALGILDYCNAHNIKIGSELGLIGFDNREISTVCSPTLSTVGLPLYEIGHRAAELLISTLEGNSAGTEDDILLECSIIERDSTALKKALHN